MKTTQIVGIGAIVAGIGAIAWYFWRGVGPPCTDGKTKCEGYDLYTCVNGAWQLTETNSIACGYVPDKALIVLMAREGQPNGSTLPFPGIKMYINSHSCDTDANGECTITDLEPGTYSVDCDVPDGYYAVGGVPFNKVVEAGNNVAGVLLVPEIVETGDLEGLTVIQTVMGPVVVNDLIVSVEELAGYSDISYGGRYKIVGLPAGTYTVRGSYPPGGPQCVDSLYDVVITAGQTMELDVYVDCR